MEYPHRVTSNPYSFFEFQSDELKLKKILESKGINYGSHHRFALLYDNWAKKSKEVHKKGVTNVSPLETLNLLDLCEMNSIIKALPRVPTAILKDKWGCLIKGTVNRFEETKDNSIGRNTQFELLLYADFLNSGVSCELSHPNPDILILHKGIGVNIQCKRPLNYSPRTIESNINTASRQLREDHKANGNLGVIALSIERMFSSGNSFLQSQNQYTAIDYVRRLHDAFNEKNKRLWNTKAILGTEKIPLVILYTSTMAQTQDEKPPFVHVTERDLMETISSPSNRKNFNILRPIFSHQH